MYIHPPKRLIYLAHPRTASNATAQALNARGFVPPCGSYRHHAPLYDPERTPIRNEPRALWTVFTTVRHHADAICSWVASTLRRERLHRYPLELVERVVRTSKWIRVRNPESGEPLPDGRWSLWSLHADDADVELPYEQLQPSLDGLLTAHGLEPVQIPRYNETYARNGRPWEQLLGKDARAWIARKFEAEMHRFGYKA